MVQLPSLTLRALIHKTMPLKTKKVGSAPTFKWSQSLRPARAECGHATTRSSPAAGRYPKSGWHSAMPVTPSKRCARSKFTRIRSVAPVTKEDDFFPSMNPLNSQDSRRSVTKLRSPDESTIRTVIGSPPPESADTATNRISGRSPTVKGRPQKGAQRAAKPAGIGRLHDPFRKLGCVPSLVNSPSKKDIGGTPKHPATK